MSSPLHAQITGKFTAANPVVATNISLPPGYDKFEMFNLDDIGSTASNTNVMYACGTSLMTAGQAYIGSKSGSADTKINYTTISTNGFTFLADSSLTPVGALVTATSITGVNPAVAATGTTTGVQVGSVVKITDSTGMLQIAGMDFTVTAVSAGASITLGYLDASQTNLSGGASSANYRIVPFNPRFYPARRTIVNMGVVGKLTRITMSVTHGFTIGQVVRIYQPNVFTVGTVQTPMNGQLGTIVNINQNDASSPAITNTIDVNIDSSTFPAWQWPTSATAAAGMQFAFVEPVGEAATTSAGTVNPQNLLDDATLNQSINGIVVGTSVQTAAKNYQWIATKGVSV